MTTNDTGNGNMIEIAILIPKDIPIHIIWLKRNCLLFIPILEYVSSQLSYLTNCCPNCNEGNTQEAKFSSKCKMIMSFDGYQEGLESQKETRCRTRSGWPYK